MTGSRRSPSSVGLVRARALGAFFVVGGLLALVPVLLGYGPAADDRAFLVVAAAATAMGLGLLGAGARVPAWACHLLTVAGSSLIAGAMVAAGGGAGTATFAGFFVWVAVYTSVFFRLTAVLGHLAVAVGLQAVALLLLGEMSTALTQTVLGTGSVAVVATVVGLLMRRIDALAGTDPLTGLPNRRTLDLTLPAALARARRSRRPLSVLALDLDGFKALNDAHGHAEGDRLLQAAGDAFTRQLRDGDLLARVGGDEFLAVLPDCPPDRARDVATRLAGTAPPPLAVSIGTATARADETDRDLLARADAALYSDKHRGGRRSGDRR